MLFDESVLDEMLLSPHVLQMRSMYKINRRGVQISVSRKLPMHNIKIKYTV